MRFRNTVFILLASVAVSLIGLVLTFAMGPGGRGQGAGWMGGMSSRSLWPALIVVPLVIAVAALGYIVLFPDIGEKRPSAQSSSVPVIEEGESALDAVIRVLKDDEKKVIETLVAQGGTMLQKDIRWKTGFSRVKTHRILYRLVERGLVKAEKHYNTNKITLADWLMKKKSQD